MEQWVNERLPRIQEAQTRELRTCLSLTIATINKRRDQYAGKLHFPTVYDRYCNNHLLLQIDMLVLEVDLENPQSSGYIGFTEQVTTREFYDAVKQRHEDLQREMRMFPIQFTLPVLADVRDPATSACCCTIL